MIKCHNLTKRFGQEIGFQSVNVEICAGDFLALIGPSGAGKSTLLRCLAALDPADSGNLTIDDMVYNYPLSSASKVTPWPKLTAVFQQSNLWPHLTVRENIALVLEHREHHKTTKHAAQQANRYSELLGLEKFLERYPGECSVGERQRGALARALVLNPKYILLDEITSALDVEYVSRVVEILLSLKSDGVGIIAVTHSLGLARRCANKFCFLDAGAIIEQGNIGGLAAPQEVRLKNFVSALELQSP